MNDVNKRPDWLTAEVLDHLHRVVYEFHIRAFGKEMARVNFLPLAERRRHVAEMVDHALRKGVKFDKPALVRTFHTFRSAGLRPGVSQPFVRRRVGDRRSGLWAFQGECENFSLGVTPWSGDSGSLQPHDAQFRLASQASAVATSRLWFGLMA